MTLRSSLARPFKRFLALTGRDLIGRYRYGYDAFLDIERLSQNLGYPIELYLDVGANVGATIQHVRERFKACRIIGFEPHPKTFLELTQTVAGLPNVAVENLALGSETGEVTMYEYDMSLINSLVPNAPFAVRFDQAGKPTARPITCMTLDQYCAEKNIARVDVLKIDTEGFDFEVLKGANALLARKAIRFVYFEFNDIQPRTGASGGALAPIDELLRRHGYKFIATYNDYVRTDPGKEIFGVSNALYVLPPPV